jgi:hypothetical protein
MSITQKLSKRGAFLAASLVLGAAFAATSVSAQTVSTAPVGAVTKTINVGLNSVAVTLLNPDLVVASASANTASSITLTGVTNVGSLLTNTTPPALPTPYYIEAISGPLEGERFDVDTAATISAGNSTVVLSTSSTNNTFSLSSGNAVGSKFALRKHVTFAQVQSMFSSQLVSNTSAASADQIWLLNSAGTNFQQYFLRDQSTWRLVGASTNVKDTPIPAGVGFILRKMGSANTMVSTGGVRVNDFSMPMPIGLSFKAPGYPISFSPSSLGGTSSNGWTSNNSAASADQLRVLSGGNFTSYFLRTSATLPNTVQGTEWRQVGSTTNVASSLLFTFDSGFLVSRKSADSNYILTSPISL